MLAASRLHHAPAGCVSLLLAALLLLPSRALAAPPACYDAVHAYGQFDDRAAAGMLERDGRLAVLGHRIRPASGAEAWVILRIAPGGAVVEHAFQSPDVLDLAGLIEGRDGSLAAYGSQILYNPDEPASVTSTSTFDTWYREITERGEVGGVLSHGDARDERLRQILKRPEGYWFGILRAETAGEPGDVYLVRSAPDQTYVAELVHERPGAEAHLHLAAPSPEPGTAPDAPDQNGILYVAQSTTYGNQRGSLLVVRTDHEGLERWHRVYGTIGVDVPVGVVPRLGGGWIVAANVDTEPASGAQAWLIALDPQGNRVWERRYGRPGQHRFELLRSDPAGGYVLLGGARRSARVAARPWLLRVDDQGAPLLDMAPQVPRLRTVRDLVPLPDGGYALVGHEEDPRYARGGGRPRHHLFVQTLDARGRSACAGAGRRP